MVWITLGLSGGFQSDGVRTITTQQSGSGSSFTVGVYYTSGSMINMIFEKVTKEDVVSMHRQMRELTGSPLQKKNTVSSVKPSGQLP